MKLISKPRRVHRFLARLEKSSAYQFHDLPDPRQRRGRRHTMAQKAQGLFEGLLSGCRGLRDVEAQTEAIGRRISDTTLYQAVVEMDMEPLRQKLHEQVRMHARAKRLRPEGLPCGVVAIDGKCIGVLDHDGHGLAQKQSHEDGKPYWLARVSRATLTSAAAKPCIEQLPVPAETNEMGVFPTMWQALMQAYGRMDLFEIATVDAGMTSKVNADLVHESDKGYVMALKETQPELLREAQRLLCPKSNAPVSETPWAPYRGERLRRRLYRTTEIAGYHDWPHLRQAWLVVTEKQEPGGQVVAVERRYFLTNLHRGRLSPVQILQVVRGHWGVENDANWSTDMQWHEDQMPWARKKRALYNVGLFRLMAYNVDQLLRKRHLRRKKSDGTWQDPPPWRRIFEWVWQALRLPPEKVPAPNVG